MYCKPSRNAEPKRKRQLGINLFPVLVSVPLLALLLKKRRNTCHFIGTEARS